MAVPLSYENALELVGQIYDCALYPERWSDTLTALRIEFGFHNASIALQALPDGRQLLNLTSGMEPEMAARLMVYGEEIVASWGGYEFLSRAPMDEPYVLSWVSPDWRYKGTRYYTEWVEPQGLVDLMAMGVSRDAASIGSLAFGRHKDQGPIGQAEFEAAKLILPHIQRTAAISRMLDIKSVAAQSFEETLDVLSAAVMLIDVERRIIHANVAARTMLANGDPIASRKGILSLASETAMSALDATLAQAAVNEAEIGRRGFGIPAPTADGRAHVLHVLPLKRGSLRAGLMPSAAAAIFVAPSASQLPPAGETLAALFNLTAAEARIVEMLASGKSAGEVTQALSISSNTMKTHLAHIFQKTGTRSQSELVRLAVSLSLPV